MHNYHILRFVYYNMEYMAMLDDLLKLKSKLKGSHLKQEQKSTETEVVQGDIVISRKEIRITNLL